MNEIAKARKTIDGYHDPDPGRRHGGIAGHRLAVVGFICAWALWSVSRLPVEIALIDSKPALIRYALTFAVPPIAGLLANAIGSML